MATEDLISITIDTREQTPWSFPVEVATVRVGTLKTGDYALTGDDGFAVERKSLDDFVGTISTGWERFKRELERMDHNGFRCKPIIVEADFENCCFRERAKGIKSPDHNHYQLTPAFIGRRIAELTYTYRCSVLFAGYPDLAAALCAKLLTQRRAEIDKLITTQKKASK